MKIALYIEDGLEQIVLTPQSDHEHKLLGYLHDDSRTLSIKRGKFYECQGGWLTQGPLPDRIYDLPEFRRDRDESTMLVLRPRAEGIAQPGEPS
jgi:hypothetical protein